jgi:hypothetical protein
MTAGVDDPHVGLVVEGPGDRNAVPVLFRQHLHAVGEFRDILGRPVSCNGRDNALIKGGIEGFVGIAAARPGCAGVVVVLDSEHDPACDLGPRLLARVEGIVSVPVRVCLAELTFEDWLAADFGSLGLGGRPDVRGGLAAIKSALRPRSYVKPTWQPRLAARVDIDVAASNSVSLRRALRQLDELRENLPS